MPVQPTCSRRAMHASIILSIALTTAVTAAPLRAAYTFSDLYLVQPPSPNETTGWRLSQSATGGQIVGFHRGPATGQNDRAALWTPSATTGIELNPAGFTRSQAYSASLDRQVGFAAVGTGASHAMLWSGSAASAVDLNPIGYSHSQANATNGPRQVGFANITSRDHAMVWSGSAASAVDLHPDGYRTSGATAVDATNVVGFAEFTDGAFHAQLWPSEGASSAINLHPLANYDTSFAHGVGGGQQVGIGKHTASGQLRALLWSGSAESVVGLHPAGTAYDFSWVNATNGSLQVGYARLASSSLNRALVWSGSADSVVSLHSTLPGGFLESYGLSIDSTGTIYGMALDNQINWHAVKWTFVPEPAGLAAIALALVGMSSRRPRDLVAP